MTKKLRQKITYQAATCVEEILEAIATNGGDPWVVIVERNMKKLFKEDTYHEPTNATILKKIGP